MHELRHNLGQFHEQSRPDRDQYVDVHWDEIEADKRHNFYKTYATGADPIPSNCNTVCSETVYTAEDCDACARSEATTFDLAYDPFSVMHYGRTFFAKAGGTGITLTLKTDAEQPLGGNFQTELDIQKLNAAYSCPAQTCGGLSMEMKGTIVVDADEMTLNCQWIITAPPGYLIVMEFNSFSVRYEKANSVYMSFVLM